MIILRVILHLVVLLWKRFCWILTKYTGNDVIIEFIGLSDFGPNCYLNDIYVENAPTVLSLVD